MKKILFILVLMSGCSKELPDAKYVLGQKVLFDVPKFYSSICEGKGRISDTKVESHIRYYAIDADSLVSYEAVRTKADPKNAGYYEVRYREVISWCYRSFWIKENDVSVDPNDVKKEKLGL